MDRIRKKERKNWFYCYNMIFEVKRIVRQSDGSISHVPLSEHAKLIYLYLCRRADDEQQAFPSTKTICQDCSIKSRTTVWEAINELIGVGLLDKEARFEQVKESGKTRQTSNVYCIYDYPEEGKAIVSDKQAKKDIPCSPNEHPPVHQADTPCPPDEHSPVHLANTTLSTRWTPPCSPGEHQEGLPSLKDYPEGSIKTDRLTDGSIGDVISVFKKQVGHTGLCKKYTNDVQLLDEIMLNIADMYCSESVVIGGSKKPQELVRSAINKLGYWHIEYVLERFMSYTEPITNKKSFLQSMMYNSVFEMETHYMNMCNAASSLDTG